MSAARQYLVCDSLEHAALVDQLALAYLISEENAQGAEWSGIWVKPGLLSDTYAVLWEHPLARLLGPAVDEEGSELLPVVTDEAGEFEPLPPPEPEEEP